MDNFPFAYEFTRTWEGGWSDVPGDRGGKTNFGITMDSFRDYAKRDPGFMKALGVAVPVTEAGLKALTASQARDIIKKFYWTCYGLDSFPRLIAAFLFDCCVNHGWGNAVLIAQRGYNNCSSAGKPFSVPALVEDGRMGPNTKTALTQFEKPVLIEKACDAREAFYRALAKKDSQKKFLQGWLNRVNAQREYLGAGR